MRFALRFPLPMSATLILLACGQPFWNPPNPADRPLPPGPERLDDIRTIHLAQHGCFGRCPVYSLTLHSDGSAVYEGQYYAQFIGRYVASVDSRDFGALAKQLVGAGYFRLAEKYSVHLDVPTVTVSVTFMRDSLTTRTVWGSTYAVPELHVVTSSIDSVAAHLTWVAARH